MNAPGVLGPSQRNWAWRGDKTLSFVYGPLCIVLLIQNAQLYDVYGCRRCLAGLAFRYVTVNAVGGSENICHLHVISLLVGMWRPILLVTGNSGRCIAGESRCWIPTGRSSFFLLS